MFNKLFDFVEGIVDKTLAQKESKVNYNEITDDYPDLLKISKPDNIIIKTDSFNIKIYYAKEYSIGLFLADDCDRSKLKVKITQNKELLKIVFTYSGNNAKGYLVLKLPELNCAEIINDNGEIVLQDVKVDTAHITASNGNVLLKTVSFKAIEAVSKNGDIVVTLKDSCKLVLETRNGNISRKKCKSDDSSSNILRCKSTNGDIVVRVK